MAPSNGTREASVLKGALAQIDVELVVHDVSVVKQLSLSTGPADATLRPIVVASSMCKMWIVHVLHPAAAGQCRVSCCR